MNLSSDKKFQSQSSKGGKKTTLKPLSTLSTAGPTVYIPDLMISEGENMMTCLQTIKDFHGIQEVLLAVLI